jgi:hypothetical protein
MLSRAMRYLSRILGFAILACGASVAFGNDPLAALSSDAVRLAQCMKALDAPCVIALSDVNSYQLLASPDSHFAQSQSRFFDAMRRAGRQYTDFRVSAAREIFSSEDRDYAFVPYVETLEINGQASEYKAYFVATSADGGDSWTFFDGRHITPANIRQIIPSYSGQLLPPVTP